MKQELDKLLCEKYPKMMINRNKSMQETCMCWGFECGDGWFNVLDQLMGNIQHHIDDVIDGMVRMAESMSGVTCEECGNSGTTGGQGWLVTLCETHRTAREERQLIKQGFEQ
jgi:hypothetical protein